MNKSRTEAVIKNSSVMVLLQILKLGIMFVQRTVLVKLMPVEYLGIEGLFSNILQLLNLFELGIGSALTYAMYRPMAEGDEYKLSQLMLLYKKVYTVIGALILVVGLSMVPFLGGVFREAPDVANLPLIFSMYVFNTAVSYFFVYQTSILVVSQEQFIVYVNSFVFTIAQNIIQIVVLFLTCDYVCYFSVAIACTILTNVSASFLARRRYPYIVERPSKRLPKSEVRAIADNVAATALNKIGWTVQNGLDSIVISRFVGIVAVGMYSNYLLVTTAALGMLQKFYTALTPSVGNLGASADAEHASKVFAKTLLATGFLASVTTVCLYACLQPLIVAWLGRDFLLPTHTLALVCVMTFMAIMRRCAYTFDEAYGLFVHCKHKPVGESLTNVVISVLLAQTFGIDGVLLGTIVSQLAFSFWIEPLVLFRYALGAGLKSYFLTYLRVALVTLASSAVCAYIGTSFVWGEVSFFSVAVAALISLILSAGLYHVAFRNFPGYEELIWGAQNAINRLQKKHT